ncbi:MAG: TIR domain-containing protein [Gallionella sp.]|jgi:hypothetical protein
MSQKTVFISYRRDSFGKAFARLLKLELTHHGYDVFLDVDCLDAGQWADQILTQVPKRAHFLLLLTPGALDRCADESDWVRREFLLAQQYCRNIVPIQEESVDIGKMCDSAHESMQPAFGFQIATIQHNTFESDIETLITRFIAPHKAPVEVTPSVSAFQPDISRIIKYAPAELIGRETETKLLNDAWSQAVKGEAKRPHVLTIVALGGEGKTSLVAKWAAELAHNNWPGCEAVFAWSFYSQGISESASSDLFLAAALTYFGDAEMAESSRGAYDKGKRLAQLVGEKRALLILDGVEPLQYAPTSPMPGELKDAGISALLKGLAASSKGLCVVTTRYSIPDLKAYWQTTAPEEKLTRLSKEAGVSLLKFLDVKGNQNEFEKLVEDVKGHALTLNLLGSYLRDAHAGDIRKRDLVKLEEADDEEQGGHAFRVVDAYAQWFETGGKDQAENKKGLRALALLRLMGLFDRPAPADCIAELLKAPAIPDLTKVLAGMSEAQRNLAFARLEAAKLLTVNRDTAGALISLDAHPLLREYFAKQIREQHLGAWRNAHRRIYKHLVATTNEGDQPTLEKLQPLYQAVAHGCLAGMQQEACEKVYHERILRGAEAYSVKKLGAFSSDLGAVACFFEQPWNNVSPALTEDRQAWLLAEAAFRLRALGRLAEAIVLMRAGLEMRIKQDAWLNAAIIASNLSELELTLGALADALRDAELSVNYADRSSDVFFQIVFRVTHANTLHQAGNRPAARALFTEAEFMQVKHQADYPLLYSMQGFKYCDLLLSTSERAAWLNFLLSPASWGEGMTSEESGDMSQHSKVMLEVSERATQAAKLAEHGEWLADIALDHLTLGSIGLYQANLGNNAFDIAHSELNKAVGGLRRAGTQDLLPRSLLTRAWLRCIEGNRTGSESAQTDLDEAWEIAERGPMPLYMADIHLYRARLFFRETTYPWESPQADLADARRLIEKHGYWRRREELEDAEAAILDKHGKN